MVPWSVWSALGLKDLGNRLAAQGWSTVQLRRLTAATFTALATACGLGFWLAGPWLDRRGVEWAFYETTGRRLLPGEPLALLYDDWDRDPYPTPFGAIPHDLAVRLYYLERPACWHFNTASLRSQGIGICSHCTAQRVGTSLAILGRERDLPALRQWGILRSFREARASAGTEATCLPGSGSIENQPRQPFELVSYTRGAMIGAPSWIQCLASP